MRSLLLSVLLVLFSQSAGAQAPVVTPRGLLPGDATVAAAAGTQQDHALARGGDAYLVVWSDYRGQTVGGGTTNANGGGGAQESDIDRQLRELESKLGGQK